MIRKCPVCGNIEDNVIIGWLPSTIPTISASYNLVQCLTCQIMYISPIPTAEILWQIHSNYEAYAGPAYQDDRKNAAVNYFAYCLKRMCHHLGLGKQPIRLLDIGGGLSLMSLAAKSIFDQAFTVALGWSKEAVQPTKGYVDRYCVGQLTDCLGTLVDEGPFHLITMAHVIETMVDPKAAFHQLAGLTARPALIFITSPHRPPNWATGPQSISQWRLWTYNHTPRHLQYFHEHSLNLLAADSGCRMVHFSDVHEDGQALEAWFAPRDN